MRCKKKGENLIDIIIGTYQTEKDEAIQIITFNKDTWAIEKKGRVVGIDAPSFLAIDGTRVFAVSEGEEGLVYSYHYDPATYELEKINQRATRGNAPCYVLFDETVNALYITNYMSGSVAVLPVNEQAEIGECGQLLIHEGSSVNRERQESAHMHAIDILPFAPRFKIAQDLGSDTVSLYETAQDGMLTLCQQLAMPPGSGPRHVAFCDEKKMIYVVGELSSTIEVLHYHESEQRFTHVQSISSLPSDFSGENTSAHVQINREKDAIFVSNRGHDSITIFTIREDGTLAWQQNLKTGGEVPRHFTVLQDELIVIANQQSNNVTFAKKNKEGLFELLDVVYEIEKPVFVSEI